jgi:hypothetical protein
MPLARIVTDFPEEALELATQLQARGFQVETLSPHVTSTTLADLEVRLEECAVDDVLAHATQMASGDVACVYVAPGALEEGGRSGMKTISLMAVVDDRRGREMVSHEARLMDPAPAVPVHVEVPEPAFALVSTHAEAVNSEKALDGELNEVAVPVEPQFAEVTVAARVEQGEEELLLMEIEAQRASTVPAALAVVDDNVSETDMAAEPHVIPISAEPRESLVVAQNDLGPDEVETRAVKNSAPGTDILTIPLPPVPQAQRATVTRLRSRAEADRAFWRIAVAAAMMAALVVAAGSFWHRFRPMPEHLSEPTSQQIPFRRATAPAPNSQKNESAAKAPESVPAQPSHVSSNGGANANPAPPAAVPAPPTNPVASAAPPASASQVVVRSSAVQRVPAKKPSAKRKSTSEPDIIAEDTVVFYDKRPGATRARGASQPGVKQYSDAQ